MELVELQDYPYTGERRPFDWFCEEPAIPAYKCLVESPPCYTDVVVAMLVYMADRKRNYIDYVKRGKLIFKTLVPAGLKDKAEHWTSEVTKQIGFRGGRWDGFTDWSPAFEIQRLWIATGIHWSWLELAWLEAENLIWASDNGKMKAKLERVQPHVRDI